MKSRNVIKWLLYIIGLFFILFIILGIAIIILLLYKTSNYEYDRSTNPWEASYYIYSIIGTIGTLSAVIVALAKERIMNWIFSPSLEITPIDESVIVNYSGQGGTIPDSYDYNVRITNEGTLAAIACKANISEIKYKKSRNQGKLKTIVNCKKQPLRWISKDVDLLVDIPSELLLFQITNPNQSGTPQATNQQIRPRIEINGCQLPANKNEQGYWVIDYYINSKNGSVTRFQLIIDWEGAWSDNKDEMQDGIMVELKKL